LRGADPEVPNSVFNRAADNWRPLLAIADVAGARPGAAAASIESIGEPGRRRRSRWRNISESEES